MATQNLLVELLVEELPPKALKILGEAFADGLFNALEKQHLVLRASVVSTTSFASPRRLAVHIPEVLSEAPDRRVSQKLMPVSVGLDESGAAKPALLKKLQSLGADASAVPGLKRAMDGKSEALFYDSIVKGATLAQGLQNALNESLSKLPIPKVMTYQLSDGRTDVKFVRPAHSLVALHGAQVVPVEALGLKAGNTTQGHRFEAARPVIVFKEADSYAATLERDGAVIAGFAARRAEIVRQLAEAAAKIGEGVKPIEDDALLDEVTALVERPNVLICQFEKEFLQVPQECLILTMKANQKYFPLLDPQGKLTHRFLVVSNIRPEDPSAVVQGNERVVRPRLADAKFFFDQDRKKTLASRVESLAKVVYHNKLGTQGDRVRRVSRIAAEIGTMLAVGGDSTLAVHAQLAAQVAKADLVTDMVGEFPELQGIMGRYYALNDGLGADIADAVEDHYKPRFAGDELPRGQVGTVVALADKLETLVGMFGIGNLPTGDKDPFALRRHALGVVRMLVEKDLPINLHELLIRVEALVDSALAENGLDNSQVVLTATGQPLKELKHRTIRSIAPMTAEFVLSFIYDRFAGSLREQGFSVQEVDAVVALYPQRLGDVPKRLAAVRAFALLPEAPALAAANKRVGNILKKTDGVDAHVSEVLLKEPAEQALYAALKATRPQADALFEAGDYTGSLKTLAALRTPVDAFFDGVMVNAEEADLRLNRLGLLATLHQAMNRVADLSRLAS